MTIFTVTPIERPLGWPLASRTTPASVIIKEIVLYFKMDSVI